MRVLLVGAGAVGMVFYRALEEQKANELTFLVRSGGRRALERIKIVDARRGLMRVRERPAAVEPGQVLPHFDTVLFCVRGDQLAAALDQVAQGGPIPPGTRLATITPTPDGLALLRARHPGHPAVRVFPAFMAHAEDDAVVVWHPPLVKSYVAWEDGGPEDAAFAEELAAALEAGGVPTRARERVLQAIETGADAFMPLLAACALTGYHGDALAADGELLDLAARATADALSLGSAASAIARFTFRPVLRAAIVAAVPRLPAHMRTMWTRHAPKIEKQSRDMLERLGRRARDAGHPSASLDELLRRLDARVPPPPEGAHAPPSPEEHA